MRFKLLWMVVLVLFVGGTAWAGDPLPAPSTGADGSAFQQVWREHADSPLTGGFGAGNSLATYSVDGICEATGLADAFGKVIGESGSDATSAWSLSKSFVDASASGQGGPTTIDLTGFAEQGNWAGIQKDENNFANAWNYSNSGFDGSTYGDLSAQNLGKAGTVGTSNVSLTETINSRSGRAETKNVSLANVGGTGTTAVYGQGGVGVMSTIGGGTGDNYFAGAISNGGGFYNGVGENYAAGMVKVSGSTNVLNGGDFVSAASQHKTEAKLSGGTCTGDICQ